MLSDQFKSIFLDRQPAAHGSKLLLGEVNFSSTALSPNLDEQPIIRAPVRGSGLISMKRGLVRAAIRQRRPLSVYPDATKPLMTQPIAL
jgi:hypothetical protein